MIKCLFFIALLICYENAVAGSDPCSNAGFRKAYKSLKIDSSLVCFLYIPNTLKKSDNSLSSVPDGISLYSSNASGKAEFLYELTYAGTKNEIKDAFLSSIDGGKRLFVIHSMEAPNSWDVVNDAYSVTVINFDGENFVVDLRLSRFFDFGGDSMDDQGKIKYVYPYKDKASVEKAIRSPLFKSVETSTPVSAIVREKTALYGGDLEPATWDVSQRYASKNDRGTLEDSMAGWCKVSYTADIAPVRMWLICDAISFRQSNNDEG